jgi:NitT/TauT family transport system substrate-binding protein
LKVSRTTRQLPVVALVTLALGMSACGNSGDTGSPSGESKGRDTIRVLSPFPPNGAFTAPLLYAEAKGSFSKHNVKVDITDGKTSLSVANAVSQGQADIGLVGSSVTAQSINKGQKLISIAQMYGKGAYGLIVPKDSPITTLQGVAGKQTIQSAGSPETVLLPAVLKKLGVASPKVLNVDATVKGSTYSSGKADALATSIPFFLPIVNQARESRAIPFIDAGVQFPDYSIITRPDYLKSHNAEIRDFLAAFFETFNTAGADRAGVGEAMTKYRPGVTNVELQLDQFMAYQDFVCAEGQAGKPVGWHSPDDWRDGLDTFKANGGIDGDVSDLGKFYTNEFMEGSEPVSAKACAPGTGS